MCRLKQDLAHVSAAVTLGSAALLGSATGSTRAALVNIRAAALVSTTTGSTTALLIGAGITTVLLNLALLAKLSIAPAFRITSLVSR